MLCALRGRLSERGTRDKFAVHGVLSCVVCSEGEHPTPRGVDRSMQFLRSFFILFSVLFVFLTLQRLYSGRDMHIDFDMLHIIGCLKKR